MHEYAAVRSFLPPVFLHTLLTAPEKVSVYEPVTKAPLADYGDDAHDEFEPVSLRYGASDGIATDVVCQERRHPSR